MAVSQGRTKSRTMRRVRQTVPGGKTVVHYVKRKPKLGRCPVTGETLKGVPRERPYKVSKLSKSQRRPSRPYGGVLSSKAMRSVVKAEARKAQ